MAYQELVKNFNKVRAYMRDFYVYGFKSRDDFKLKSRRSYDDDKRRIESWLSEYMVFRRDADGKAVFLSIDSRDYECNPLFKAWKAKSFTDMSITLYFILLDILRDSDEPINIDTIMAEMDLRLSDGFSEPYLFDTSTVRKKLNDYTDMGIVTKIKQGRQMTYKVNDETLDVADDCLYFFSEILPGGVIGDFIRDRGTRENIPIAFKHHFITGTIDSEIMMGLIEAVKQKKSVDITVRTRKEKILVFEELVPLKIFVSSKTGREYMMSYNTRIERLSSTPISSIVSIKVKKVSEKFDTYMRELNRMQPYIWGISLGGNERKPVAHVEFTVTYAEDEAFIPKRLERECRCGSVTPLGNGRSIFKADVLDAWEMLPWIRTYIGRIENLSISDREVEERFKQDLRAMQEMYR